IAVALFALAACGGGDAKQQPGALRPAAPYTAINRAAARAPLPARVFDRPIAAYRRHVSRQLRAMLVELRGLRAAVAAGNLQGAREAWLRADARYESIGAAYGAFGARDARINGLPGGLQGGVNSPDFGGLHRVELALWGHRSVREAARWVPRLQADTAALARRIPHVAIDPLDFGLRAHEVLE